MRIYDIIEKKRDGGILSREEIKFFVKEFTAGNIYDYQASALLMAIFINGMDFEETVTLTDCMAHSGDMLDLSQINGITADKHSTGGVGDKTSLIVAPVCATLGLKIAKMSGRGLGHTGGTVDKLESIKGYRVSMTTDDFLNQVNDIGIALIGQTGNLAPADKKLYALRDVTATVDNISLIASSIMSKKLAAGARNIVLDVKCGSGAFMKYEESALKLAELMVKIGNACGRKVTAVITNMDIPLGTHIGNALEIKEVVDILNGGGDDNLRELCLVLSANLLSASFSESYEASYEKAKNALINGSALNKFKELVAAQGGDVSMIDNTSLLPSAKKHLNIVAESSGYIGKTESKIVGEASVILGAGREKLDDTIDYSAGIIISKKTGDRVEKGDLIATLYSNDAEKLCQAKKLFEKSFTITNEMPTLKPLIIKTVH